MPPSIFTSCDPELMGSSSIDTTSDRQAHKGETTLHAGAC